MSRRTAQRPVLLKVTPRGKHRWRCARRARIGAEALKDRPFKLNQRPAVPPDFRAAYQRRALIVGEFIKEEPDSRRGIQYPQGMKPDEQVDSALHALRGAYPWIEFIAYLRYRTPRGRGDQRGVGSG